MRLMPALAVALASMAATGLASAQDINLNGMLRTWSAFNAIHEHRGQVYRINEANLVRAIVAIEELTEKSFAGEFSVAKANAEAARRTNEVRATGPQQWCVYQRSHLSSTGMEFLFQ